MLKPILLSSLRADRVLAVIGTTLGQPTFYTKFGLVSGSKHTTDVVSVTNAIFYVGALVSCLAISFYGDRVGRKKTLWVASFFMILGTALQAGESCSPFLVASNQTYIGFGLQALSIFQCIRSVES